MSTLLSNILELRFALLAFILANDIVLMLRVRWGFDIVEGAGGGGEEDWEGVVGFLSWRLESVCSTVGRLEAKG